MTAPIKVTCRMVGLPQFKRQLAKLSDAASGKALERACTAGALIIRNEASIRAPKRTGTLRRSIHTETVTAEARKAVVAIGTDLEYAAIHEFGGVIHPRNARLLAIPADAAARAAGSPRGQDLVFIRTMGGQMFLIDKAGQIRYWLTGSVTIPARPYLRPAFDTKKQAAVEEMAATLRAILEKAAK